jgi:adenine-specific DNA-methyltransferase
MQLAKKRPTNRMCVMNFDRCRELLGDPFFATDDCLLFNIDCLAAMPILAGAMPESVHLAVTSPPYNIGKEYEQTRPIEAYLDWCEAWMKTVYRLIRKDGAFWLNLGYFEFPGRAKAIPIPYLLWSRSPFYLLQEVVWNYGAGVAARTMFSPRNEKFLWYVKDPENYTFHLDAIRDKNVKYPFQKKNGKLKCNPAGKNPTDVWHFPKVTSGRNRSSAERTPHPAQFPLHVIERIIKGSSNPGDVVLDPFMGSGTTAVASLSHGRKVIGFEINPGYCEIAAERIERYLRQKAQATLFD